MSKKTVRTEKKAEVANLEECRKVMKYTVQQRFVLMSMIPEEGEYFNIKNARIVREECGLNDIEQQIFEKCTMIRPGATVTDWKKVHASIPLKAIDVGEWLAKHFRKELKKQFDAEKIRDSTVELYDTFCGVPRKDDNGSK